MKFKLFASFFLVLAIVASLPVSAQKKFTDFKPGSDADRVHLENKFHAHNDARQVEGGSVQKPMGSRFAMIPSDGDGITAMANRVVPTNSLFGVWEISQDGTSHLQGISVMTNDMPAGSIMTVKYPGGGSGIFNVMKQYQLVTEDASTLEMTIDYVAVGPFIQDSPQLFYSSSTGNLMLRVVLLNTAGNVNAVVINNNVVSLEALTIEAGAAMDVDLTKFGVCMKVGDNSVTIVQNGQSDTTTLRFPSGVNQTCKGGAPTAPTTP